MKFLVLFDMVTPVFMILEEQYFVPAIFPCVSGNLLDWPAQKLAKQYFPMSKFILQYFKYVQHHQQFSEVVRTFTHQNDVVK